MTMQSVNIGAAPNDHIGDAIRVAFDKVNDNFTDLYASFEGVNVKWYGAKGDGITDDTAAIQAALVASNNIFFPAGTYLCNIEVSNTHFCISGDGWGSTILKDYDNTNPVVYINGSADYIQGWIFEKFTIQGNDLVDGLKLRGVSPTVVTDGVAQSLYIQNCKKAIHITGDDHAEVYQNHFNMILALNNDYGIYDDGKAGTYNMFSNMEITGVNDGGYGIYMVGSLNTFINIKTDGVIQNDGHTNNYIHTVIETIYGTPPTTIAFRDAGQGSKIDLTLTSIDPAKCEYGYAVYNADHIINNLRASGAGGLIPTYLFSADISSSGIIIHASSQGTLKALSYLTPAQLQNWKILNGDFFVDLLKKVVYSTAAPASGTWAVGDICYNTTPTSGGYIGWVCITAPGTFKGFGLIA